jgi:hypothetical protein
MPRLKIEPTQLLERLGADMRRDLVRGELAVALGRPGRDVISGFPLVDALPHEVGHGHLGRV